MLMRPWVSKFSSHWSKVLIFFSVHPFHNTEPSVTTVLSVPSNVEKEVYLLKKNFLDKEWSQSQHEVVFVLTTAIIHDNIEFFPRLKSRKTKIINIKPALLGCKGVHQQSSNIVALYFPVLCDRHGHAFHHLVLHIPQFQI